MGYLKNFLKKLSVNNENSSLRTDSETDKPVKTAYRLKTDPKFELDGFYKSLGSSIQRISNNNELLEMLRHYAEEGSYLAQYELGLRYVEGEGIEVSADDAYKWFMQASEKGFYKAQYLLSQCFFFGFGTSQNYSKSFSWMNKAAEQSMPEAQYELAGMFEQGKGVNQNYCEAEKLYRISAEHGFAASIYRLGYNYEAGVSGFKKDKDEAFKWYFKAAMKDYAPALCRLAKCFYQGDGIARNVNDAIKYMTMAAEQGLPVAQCYLGTMHYNNGNYAKAVKWYRKAAEQGYENAQQKLGKCYEDGIGVPKSNMEALKWYNFNQSEATVIYREYWKKFNVLSVVEESRID